MLLSNQLSLQFISSHTFSTMETSFKKFRNAYIHTLNSTCHCLFEQLFNFLCNTENNILGVAKYRQMKIHCDLKIRYEF